MDIKIYLKDGQTETIPNVGNVRPVTRSGHNNVDEFLDIIVYGTDEENRKPIATFYDVTGYWIQGRK